MRICGSFDEAHNSTECVVSDDKMIIEMKRNRRWLFMILSLYLPGGKPSQYQYLSPGFPRDTICRPKYCETLICSTLVSGTLISCLFYGNSSVIFVTCTLHVLFAANFKIT